MKDIIMKIPNTSTSYPLRNLCFSCWSFISIFAVILTPAGFLEECYLLFMFGCHFYLFDLLLVFLDLTSSLFIPDFYVLYDLHLLVSTFPSCLVSSSLAS